MIESLHRATLVSVIIPARNEAAGIGTTVRAILAQKTGEREVEVLVVDDGSSDDTVPQARAAGAGVIRVRSAGRNGNPARARNLGARAARGDPLIFLDADCVPLAGWLDTLLAAHERGEVAVGGSLDLPAGLAPSARCDYYCGWYLVHPRRPGEHVPHHPPPNLSVRRSAFESTSGFAEEQPFSYTNEERRWQAELRAQGYSIWFEPNAAVLHHNRPGFRQLLRRNYRWAYTAIPAKSRTGSARLAWLYRWPWLTVAATPAFAFAHTGYIIASWLRAGRYEPVLMLPAILASRLAYAAGMAVGGIRWMLTPEDSDAGPPRWQ